MRGAAPAGATRQEVEVADGVRLPVWVAGPADGTPILLIAGGPADHQGWRTLVPELCHSQEERAVWAPHGRSLATTFRAAVFDQRGTGESVGAPPATSAKLLGSDAVSVGRAVLGDRFVIVGESMGGMAALHAALDHPGAVVALGLLATTAGGAGLSWPSEAFVSHATAGADPGDQAHVRAGFDLIVSERFREDSPVLFEALVAHAGGQSHAGVGEVAVQVFLSHDVSSRLADIPVATVVICGTNDHAHPLPNSEFLAANIPRSRLVVVPGAGHMISTEAPLLVIDEITRLVEVAGL